MNNLILSDFTELIVATIIFCLLVAALISYRTGIIDKQNEEIYEQAYRTRFRDARQHRVN